MTVFVSPNDVNLGRMVLIDSEIPLYILDTNGTGESVGRGIVLFRKEKYIFYKSVSRVMGARLA